MGYIDKFRGILYIKDTPQRIALSFAFGAFWGCSPLLGLHTIGAFFIAWLLGLNRFIAVAGAYVTNPWTIVPIYTFSLWLGAKVIGVEDVMPDIDWSNISALGLINEIKHLLLPFIVGTSIFGIIVAVIGYLTIYYLVLRYQRAKGRVENAA
ncbi:MAG: hypothetical protein Fur0020_06190 [Thermodesulfovibrionia bacterium]